jgi:hypothetical protein
MKDLMVVLLLFLVSSVVYAANLTSCVSPSFVTCPAGAVVHNIGSCPNGSILWGCQYPNGTVVSTALPNATTTIASTIPTTTVVSNVSATSIVSLPTTIPAISAPSSNSAMLLYFSIAIVIVIILVLYYVLVSRKSLKQPTS